MHQLVPHFILENLKFGNRRGKFPAAALFVDISGFSAITDALMRHGQHGAEVLAGVMRAVFDPLVRSVYSQDGLIIGFAGDAFTALFPQSEVGVPASLRSLAAARDMQARMAAQPIYNTPYGEYRISGKIGLAMGDAFWGIVTAENGTRAAYYFRGSAVEGCAEAEHHAQAGEIVLDSSMLAQLSQAVAVEPVDAYFRLQEVKIPLSAPNPIDLPPSDLELVANFFPRELVNQVHSGEFRLVTYLFISLPTVRTEAQLEIFMRILFELQDRFGGLLNRLDFGDKGSHLLLFWGVPLAHENDIERVLEFTLELQTRTSIPISAAITHQIAHAGFVGSELREDYTCYGQGINLAARFMIAAPRGEIWLDERAAKQASRHFEIGFEGEQSFKGFADKQKVYVLLDRKEDVDAFFEGKWVGREAELAKLSEFVSPLWDGRCTGALIVWGDAGMGKSRLVYEFQNSQTIRSKRVLWAFCQTDEILRQSFNPFRYWLKRYFGVSESYAEHRNKRNFNRKLDDLIQITLDRNLADELDRTRSFLGSLVDLHWPDSLYEQLDAKGRYENTLIALTTLLSSESLQQPVVIYIEDVHWLDDDSRILLPRLVRTLTADDRQSYPVAILATSRREISVPPLGETPLEMEIDLDLLSPANLQSLVESQLGGPATPGLLKLIEQRAEGNPFFAEQIIRYLQENALIEHREEEWDFTSVRITRILPADVQAVLVARLDRLGPGVKEVVQTAAVLGREFDSRWLGQILQDSDLIQKMNLAQRAGIWSELGESHYLFKHALLREAAYAMQLRSRRERLHARAMDALESLFSADLSHHYGELAYHAEQAGLVQKARNYLEKAGEEARDSFQNLQALEYYSRALVLTPDSEYEGRFNLLLAREGIYHLQGAREAQMQDLEQLVRLADVLGEDRRRAEVSARWANYTVTTGDYRGATEAAEKAVDLANLAGAADIAVQAYGIWSYVLYSQGEYSPAFQITLDGLQLAKRENNLSGEGSLFNMLGLISVEKRDSQAARAYLEESLNTARVLGDKRGQALPLNNLGILAGNDGDYTAAQEYYLQALKITREIGDRNGESLVLGNLGWLAGLQGDFGTARDYTLQHIRIAREIGNRGQEANACINLGSFSASLQEDDAALIYARQGLSIARETGNPSGEAWALTCLGNILFQRGQWDEVNEAYHSALEIRLTLGQSNLACEPRAGLARVALKRGDILQASQEIGLIMDYLEGGGTLDGTEEPLQIYLTCYQIMDAARDPRGEDILKTAYDLLQARAAKVRDEGLRRNFLENVPHHQAIIAAWDTRQASPKG